MANTKETIRIIVNNSIDSMIESLTDKIYNELKSITSTDKQNTEKELHNNSVLMLDTNLFSEEDKQTLASYADDLGFINVTTISDTKVICLILEMSAKYGHLEIVKFLVENGAIIDDSSALNESAAFGHFEIVKFLIENGASNHSNALKYSAEKGHFEIVKLLIEKGADINNSDALKYSAINGHFEIVEFLIEKGADINNSNALKYSAKSGQLKMVKFLVNEYLKKGIRIPNDCITKEMNDINKFLFLYTNADQDSLFNDEIVSLLSPIKSFIV